MLEALAKTIRNFRLQLPIALMTVLLSPLTVTAEPNDQSCETAQKQIDQTQHTLLPVKKQQQQIQQHVRSIYQELFVCKAGTALSLEQQKYCTHLQEEGAQKFQAMINVITLAHQASQQLASQTRQFQIACQAIPIARLNPLEDFKKND